jgi:hypothetical protein
MFIARWIRCYVLSQKKKKKKAKKKHVVSQLSIKTTSHSDRKSLRMDSSRAIFLPLVSPSFTGFGVYTQRLTRADVELRRQAA